MTKSDHERVIDAVRERFYEEGELSIISDIKEETGLSDHITRSVIDDLLGNQIVKLYESEGGNPDIYATNDMFNAITAHVREPDWIEEYEFEEKQDLRGQVKEANDKISKYQELELLLHAQGTPLEDSIERGLKELGFDSERTEDSEDFFFEFDGEYFVAEAKGKGGKIEKEDINQLGGWLESKIDEGYTADNLNGVLFHNANKNTPPGERGDALTSHAAEFLKIYGFQQISTYDFYLTVKEIGQFDGSEDEKNKLVKRKRSEFIEEITNG